MTADVRELLPLYALGILEPDEAQVVERAIAADPALASELASYRDATSELIVPVAPSPAVKSRLLASVGGGPLERFANRMASLFDVAVERAREILGLVERPASWELGAPGIGLAHFDGGPAYATADCGFVRIDRGATFPMHSHLGEEVSLILSGALRDDQGHVYSAGDELVQAPGSAHHLTAIGDEPCIFAVRVIDGISIGGAPMRFQR